MALKKRDQAVEGPGGDNPVTQCRLAERLPLLIEWLGSARYEDGSIRVLPSMTIFVEPGCLKACLNDRDQSLVAFLSAGSLTGLLDALEAGLAEDSLDWRVANQGYKKKGKAT